MRESHKASEVDVDFVVEFVKIKLGRITPVVCALNAGIEENAVDLGERLDDAVEGLVWYARSDSNSVFVLTFQQTQEFSCCP